MSCWLTGSIFFPIFFFLALFLLWPHLSDFFKTETLVGRKKDSKRILKPILLLLNFSFFFSWFKKISRFGKKICFTPISRIWRLPKMKNKFLNFVLWKILLSTFWKNIALKYDRLLLTSMLLFTESLKNWSQLRFLALRAKVDNWLNYSNLPSMVISGAVYLRRDF